MTAFIPPTMHEEIDFLEEVERDMMALTTAELEGISSDAMTPTSPSTAIQKTVIPAEAAGHAPGPHNPLDVPDDNSVATSPMGYGSRPSPG